MLQRDQILHEQRQRIIKRAIKKYWLNSSKRYKNQTLNMKICIDCSNCNYKSEEIDKFINIIENINLDTLCSSDYYEEIAVAVYEVIATDYPDRSISIELSNNNHGMVFNYETHSPSTLLKI